jgi:hypothetical protein
MRGNDKGSIITGLHANENYAREILQLFSIGLYRMWPDGTLVMDSSGDLVPTYDQNVIMGFASVFTGWNYYQANQVNGRLPTNFGPAANYINPMVLVPTHHELGTKRLLDNVVLPQAWGAEANSTVTNYDLYGPRELESALDSIFYNENVGPFICRQLIQRLVTSHPTREYLYRVAQKFNDNGAGMRGDMQAVIKAILLDYEARDPIPLNSPTFGKQREPLLRVTAAARAFPPPAPIAGTYTQAGDRTITVTLPVPHRLNSGDTINLALTDTSGHPSPATKSYTVQSTWSNNLALFTVNDAAFVAGTYTLTTNSTITNMLSGGFVTTNVVMVNISGHGLAIGNSVYLGLAAAGTYTQTNTTITNMLTSANVTTNIIMVNIVGHGLAIGDNVNLHFTTGLAGYGPTNGPASNGVYQVMWSTNNDWFAVITADPVRRVGNCYLTGAANDGLRQVFWSTNNNWFAVSHPLANARLTNNCLISKITGGGYVQNAATINISTPINHGLNPSDSVYIDFTQNYGTDGLYTINTVPDASHFTITSPLSANQTQNDQVLFPQVAPPWFRSGTATVSWNTYNVNYTDTGAASSLSQTPLHSPTVFNFYFPEFKFPGPLAAAGLTTPEFMLTSDTEVMFQMNFLEGGVLNNTSNTNGLSSFSGGDGDITLDLGPYMTQAYTINSGIPSLVDTLSSLLMAGQLSGSARNYIINYVANNTNFAYSSPPTLTQMRDRVRAVVHLLLMSPDYTIQR